jgi:putative N6-adenine-specific DNA methylase
MTDFAARNAERAGVAAAISIKTVDALQRPPPTAAGTMMLNPPYGERLAPKGRGGHRDSGARAAAGASIPTRESAQGSADTQAFFAQLAAHWKRHYAGWTAWVLSPDMKLASHMRLKESRRVPMWNGPIECRLFRFDLVAGSMRARGPVDASDPVA